MKFGILAICFCALVGCRDPDKENTRFYILSNMDSLIAGSHVLAKARPFPSVIAYGDSVRVSTFSGNISDVSKLCSVPVTTVLHGNSSSCFSGPILVGLPHLQAKMLDSYGVLPSGEVHWDFKCNMSLWVNFSSDEPPSNRVRREHISKGVWLILEPL
jgi:hypothetical protein